MSALDHELSLEAHEWRARISNGLSDNEQREFSRWVAAHPAHGEAFAEAEIMWGAIGRIDLSKTQVADPEDEILADLSLARARVSKPWVAALKTGGSPIAPRLAAGLMTLVVAAVLWIVIDPPFGSSQSTIDRVRYASSATATKMINLADGSTIRLSPGSELYVEQRPKERFVDLIQGEASYKVVRNVERPFTVQTPFANVEVTGTRFSTELRNGGVEVAVVEGSVDVFANGDLNRDESQFVRSAIAAGEAIWTTDGVELESLPSHSKSETLASHQGQAKAVSASRQQGGIDSRRRQQTYLNAALSEVVADMNRYALSPISVAPEVAEIQLTGTFDVADTEGLLATIDAALPVDVVRGAAGTRLAPE